jgi:WD40 repeat protein
MGMIASRIPLFVLLALFLTTALRFTPARGDDSFVPTYERDIKPILAKRCTVCHSSSKQDDLELSGGLALDSIESVLAGTKGRKVIVPGRADDSELVRRLANPDVDRRMPLEDKPLSAAQRELFRRWINAGAPRGSALAAAALGSRVKPTTNARPRRVASLDVVIPTDVKLAPKTWNAVSGGVLDVSAPIGPIPAVTALALRGDSRLLAVGTYSRVALWDLAEGRPTAALFGIPGPVHALAFSRDGRRLAVGAGLPARFGLIRVYSVPDGTKIHEFTGHGDVVFALAFRPDGGQLASASFDQTVRFWDLGQGRPAGIFRGHSDFVYTLAYTPDGKAIYSAGKDRTIKRINSRTHKEERTYSSHDDDVLAVAIRPDGRRFVSAGNEPQLQWWALDGDRPLARRGGHSGAVQQLVFSGDGRRLLSAGGDGSVRVWNGTSGEPIRSLPGARDWQYAVAISDDGRLAAAGGWDGLVRLWDADSGRLRATLVQPPTPSAGQDLDAVPAAPMWLAVSPGGHLAGSTGLIGQVSWRAGGVTLPAEAARRVCVSGESVGRALRGDPVSAVSFPPTPTRN